MEHKLLIIKKVIFLLVSSTMWLSSAIAENNASNGGYPIILSQGTIKNQNFLPDFSYAGYRNGAEDLPVASGTVIGVDEFGAVPDDGKDDSKAILAAISATHSIGGPVIVRFSPGRYRITEILHITRGELVLQGSGSGTGGTTLYFPRPLNQIDDSNSLDELRQYIVDQNKRQKEPDKNIDEFFSEYSWSGGFIWIQKPGTRAAPYLEAHDPEIIKLADIEQGQRGGTTLRISEQENVKAGDVIQVQWINNQGPDAEIIKSLYGDEAKSAGSHHWSFPDRPLVRQTTRVISVENRLLTIGDPLLHDVGPDIPAQIAEWDHLYEVGIEGFGIEFPVSPYPGHHLEAGYNGIYMTSAFDSWIRDIRISNADAGILTYNSGNLTIRDIISQGERGGHYAVHMGNVHNVLAENILVYNPVIHSLTFNTQSTKCVYKNSVVFSNAILDQHAGANHQNLFDNVTLHVTAMAGESGPQITVFDGSGAGYWQPGHGAFNTTWNLKLQVSGAAYPGEPVTVLGIDEGPLARIVGLHGNRKFTLDYRPVPYMEMINSELSSVPSLYDFQLSERMKGLRKVVGSE